MKRTLSGSVMLQCQSIVASDCETALTGLIFLTLVGRERGATCCLPLSPVYGLSHHLHGGSSGDTDPVMRGNAELASFRRLMRPWSMVQPNQSRYIEHNGVLAESIMKHPTCLPHVV